MFCHLLMNVGDANPIIEDWKLLMSHTSSLLDSSTKDSFNRAIHLFASNEDVNNHNRCSLAYLNHHIACSVVTISRKCYCYAYEEKLEGEIVIYIGSRVMLTPNLWTDATLVDGALGIIEKIVYDLRWSPLGSPTYVLVVFDNYAGIPWDELLHQIIHIVPIERGTTRQLLVKLAWGLTVHKSRGLTLVKLTINIGNKERQGLTFTTLSRAKGLDGLLIQPPFRYDKYENMAKWIGVSSRKKKKKQIEIDHFVIYLYSSIIFSNIR